MHINLTEFDLFIELNRHLGINFVESLDPYHRLVFAAAVGYVSVVEKTLRVIDDPSFSDSIALRFAAYYGNIAIVGLLLSDGRVKYPLAVDMYDTLVRRGLGTHYEITRLLLERYPSDRDIDYAFGTAVVKNKPNFVKLFLKYYDPSGDDSFGLYLACKYDHQSIVEILLKDGRSSPRAHGHDALRVAIKYDHYDCVNMLIDDGRIDGSMVEYFEKEYETTFNNNIDKKFV